MVDAVAVALHDGRGVGLGGAEAATEVLTAAVGVDAGAAGAACSPGREDS